MVVRLDLEDAREPVADVDGAGILARPLEHERPGRRQRPQQRLARLVAAVLAPERTNDAQLESIRLAPKLARKMLILRPRQRNLSQLGVAGSSELDAGHDAAAAGTDPLAARSFATLPNSCNPSAEPKKHSHPHSGGGIIPSTFRRSLRMPAMSRIGPFGDASPTAVPSRATYRNATRSSRSRRSSVSSSAT